MADADIFLKVDGVDGESQDAERKSEMELAGFNMAVFNQSSAHAGGGGGAGKAQVEDFHFTMELNKGSQKLFLASLTGEHFPKAVVTCRKAGGKQEDFLKITMTHVMVTKFLTTQAASSRGDHVTKFDGVTINSVALSFAQIEQVYREQKSDGTLGPPVKVAYDVKARKKL